MPFPFHQHAIVRTIQRHQAFTYGPNRISQHKNPSVNTKSDQYLQTCTEKTSLRQIVVATVKNTDTTNFGHMTKVTKTSNLILHKMTSTDLDEYECLFSDPKLVPHELDGKLEFAKSGTLINRWIFFVLF